jgi:hypothetical protein
LPAERHCPGDFPGSNLGAALMDSPDLDHPVVASSIDLTADSHSY